MPAPTKLQAPVKDVGTSYSAAYTSTGIYSAVNEIHFANKSASSVTVDVEIWPGGISGSAIGIEHNRPLAPNQVWGYKGYRALIPGDEIRIKASATTSVDCLISGLEHSFSPPIIYQGIKREISVSPTYDTIFTATNDVWVNDLAFFNKGAAAAYLSAELWPLGNVANKVILVPSQLIKPNKRFDHIGVWAMADTDLVKVSASVGSSIDGMLSAVE